MSESDLTDEFDDEQEATPPITPAKVGVIGLLASVLLGVIYWNFLRESEGTKPDSQATDSATEATADRTATAEVAEDRLWQVADWPKAKLTPVAMYDPFRIPTRFPQPPKKQTTRPPTTIKPDANAAGRLREERAEAILQALSSARVQLVFESEGEKVAVIAGHEVRVGDLIGGYRVAAIDHEGVVLEGDRSR